jgi:hypothetical protein
MWVNLWITIQQYNKYAENQKKEDMMTEQIMVKEYKDIFKAIRTKNASESD